MKIFLLSFVLLTFCFQSFSQKVIPSIIANLGGSTMFYGAGFGLDYRFRDSSQVGISVVGSYVPYGDPDEIYTPLSIQLNFCPKRTIKGRVQFRSAFSRLTYHNSAKKTIDDLHRLDSIGYLDFSKEVYLSVSQGVHYNVLPSYSQHKLYLGLDLNYVWRINRGALFPYTTFFPWPSVQYRFEFR